MQTTQENAILTKLQDTVLSHIKAGDANALRKLQAEAGDAGNDKVTLDWDNTFDQGQLTSTFNLKPKEAGSVITCTLLAMSRGDDVLGSAMAGQVNPVTADGESSYSGWLWRDYTPPSPGTVTVTLGGTVTDSSGNGASFSFEGSISV